MPQLDPEELAAVRLRSQIKQRQWYAPRPQFETHDETLEYFAETQRCVGCLRWIWPREGRPKCPCIIEDGYLSHVPPEVLAFEGSGA